MKKHEKIPIIVKLETLMRVYGYSLNNCWGETKYTKYEKNHTITIYEYYKKTIRCQLEGGKNHLCVNLKDGGEQEIVLPKYTTGIITVTPKELEQLIRIFNR